MKKISSQVANQIVNTYKGRITGRDIKEFININPDERLLAGKLYPCDEDIDRNKAQSNIRVSQLGIEFNINEKDVEEVSLEITPRGFFCYDAIPDYEQMRDSYMEQLIETGKIDSKTTFNDLVENYNNETLNENVQYFKARLPGIKAKYKINKSYTVFLKKFYNTKVNRGYFEVDTTDYCTEMCDSIVDGKNGESYLSNPKDEIELRNILNTVSWTEYVAYTYHDPDTLIDDPKFKFGISVEVKKVSDICNITVSLTNTADCEKSQNKKNNVKSKTLFDAGLEVVCHNADIIPIKLENVVNTYKYDPYIYAQGNNCSVEYKNGVISTTHMPVYFEHRIMNKDTLKAKFKDLIDNPVETLEQILKQMNIELDGYKRYRDEMTNTADREEIQKNIDLFTIEIERFKIGIDLMNTYNTIKNAFIYLNKTFERACVYDSWRLFQIVYIVSVILDFAVNDDELKLKLQEPEIANKSHFDSVDIINFPTGSGKTEAFQGVTIFNLFFDRLRGKDSGVTAIIKYPGRMLTSQQIERLTKVIAKAEQIRVENRIEGVPFALGYFVGNKNMPNKISSDNVNLNIENNSITVNTLKRMTQEDMDNNYRFYSICPFCGEESIHVHFDERTHTLQHVCNNAKCFLNVSKYKYNDKEYLYNGVFPMYVVDYDIYRFLPSIVIMTVDKLASMGNNARFHNLIYGAKYRCPDHGFLDFNSCCGDKSTYLCQYHAEDYDIVKMYDPAPTLMIQDEMHSLSESLGTFASHYETAFEYHVQLSSKENENNVRGIKVIGATATVSEYKNLTRHLYWKDATLFPAPSPYPDKDFYTYIDSSEISRIFLGYTPFGTAIINSIVYSLECLRQIVWELYNNPDIILEYLERESVSIVWNDGQQIEDKRQIVKMVAAYYWIIINFCNVKKEINRVRQALEDPINPELIKNGMILKNEKSPFESVTMTGDTSLNDIKNAMLELENIKSPDELVEKCSFNIILATSTISHGVDAKAFNIMHMYGMSGTFSEHIQTSSRVGREMTGIVIVVMRPSRDKEQSIQRNFTKLHELVKIFVEPTPVNRWAIGAIKKTLPGILSSLLLCYYGFKNKHIDTFNDVKIKTRHIGNLQKEFKNGSIKKEELKSHLMNIYKCNEINGTIGRLYIKEIDNILNDLFSKILNRKETNNKSDYYQYTPRVFKELGFPVMGGLRTTEKYVILECKF